MTDKKKEEECPHTKGGKKVAGCCFNDNHPFHPLELMGQIHPLCLPGILVDNALQKVAGPMI